MLRDLKSGIHVHRKNLTTMLVESNLAHGMARSHAKDSTQDYADRSYKMAGHERSIGINLER